MNITLENGCEIVQGQNVRIGLMQTEDAGKPEAHLFWLEGQGMMTLYEWRRCSRIEAIAQINAWLGNVGLALDHGKIVEF